MLQVYLLELLSVPVPMEKRCVFAVFSNMSIAWLTQFTLQATPSTSNVSLSVKLYPSGQGLYTPNKALSLKLRSLRDAAPSNPTPHQTPPNPATANPENFGSREELDAHLTGQLQANEITGEQFIELMSKKLQGIQCSGKAPSSGLKGLPTKASRTLLPSRATPSGRAEGESSIAGGGGGSGGGGAGRGGGGAGGAGGGGGGDDDSSDDDSDYEEEAEEEEEGEEEEMEPEEEEVEEGERPETEPEKEIEEEKKKKRARKGKQPAEGEPEQPKARRKRAKKLGSIFQDMDQPITKDNIEQVFEESTPFPKRASVSGVFTNSKCRIIDN